MFAALAVGSNSDSSSVASSPLVSLVVRTHRLRYHAARPPSRRTPWIMPSPKNQCDDVPLAGFGPLRR